MSVGVAIIGGGIFAREEHLPAVQASPHLSLKAIYSRSLKSAQSLAADTSVDLYSEDSDQGKGKGFEAVLARSDVQAVIIALPILVQPDFIKKAILAGKHVLSEKPVAKDLATAQELIRWYGENGKAGTWSVAENFRYLKSFDHAAEKTRTIGKLVEFRVKRHVLVKGGKYFETEWRKTPQYQGGFLLDGGVHDTAATRLLLGSDVVSRLSAFTRQNQPHLPPKDTIDATLQLKSGATGTYSQSFGTTFPNSSEWAIAGEKGTVVLTKNASIEGSDARGNVVIVYDADGKELEKTLVEDERTGVPPEVKAWGEALAAGKTNAKQRPEEALADLELIEKMLTSGDNGGAPQALTLQI